MIPTPRLRVGLVLKPLVQLLAAILSGLPPPARVERSEGNAQKEPRKQMKIHRNNRCCWTLFIAVALLCEAASLCAQDASTIPVNDLNALVFAQAGDLPIILSAPHGGTGVVPGVTERTGVGLATGPSGFFTGRDTGTEELAREVFDAIKKRFGKSPYVVISKVHRKFLDPNRPADIAFEDPKIQPVYDHYHDSLSKYCREVTDRFQVGVLIDIQGQGSLADTVFRGTKNGLTVIHLRETFGEASHHGAQSLFGLLSTRGWTVHPSPHNEKEQAGFSGGFIVQSYGSHKALPIDAMQLEFGAEYRMASRRAKTAEDLADALAEYVAKYLQIKAPPVSKTTSTGKPPMKVAVFVDEGVSSTKQLFVVLESDTRLHAEKISAKEIRAGKLSEYSVLIHPGGSGGGQGKALGEEGRQKVREFVEDGHGMVGICAGAYLASCDYEWSLKILDAKVIDRKHWNRGFGIVDIALSPLGQATLALTQDRAEIYYHQGPLLAPADNPQVSDYRALATFAGEIAENGAPTGVMPGTTAIALGEFGRGRVICFSPHPEKTPNLKSILLQAIHWASGELTVEN